MSSLAQILKPLDPGGSLPLYQQLQRAIREAIETRVLGPDDALPAERQIAADLSVSRITVRKAIEGLVEEGLLVRRQGSGNFVAARIEKNFAKLTSFSEDMRSRGRTPHSKWLKRAEGAVTPEEALALRRRRAHVPRVRDGRGRLPAIPRGGRQVPLRSARDRRQSPGTGPAAPARAAPQCGAGEAPPRARRRCGPPRRA